MAAPGNPFAVLTAVVAPAILTNASSILCLGTGNRIARVVDRTRHLVAEMPSLQVGSPEHTSHVYQLQVRSRLLLRSLRIFYATLGGFAAAALISVIGSALAYCGFQLGFQLAAILGLVIGGFAVAGLVTGCALMVRETRFAVEQLEQEAALARNLYRSTDAG
jgi:hypothetical protein